MLLLLFILLLHILSHLSTFFKVLLILCPPHCHPHSSVITSTPTVMIHPTLKCVFLCFHISTNFSLGSFFSSLVSFPWVIWSSSSLWYYFIATFSLFNLHLISFNICSFSVTLTLSPFMFSGPLALMSCHLLLDLSHPYFLCSSFWPVTEKYAWWKCCRLFVFSKINILFSNIL